MALPTIAAASSSSYDALSNISSNSCTHALGSNDSESLEFSDLVSLELRDSELSAADIAGARCKLYGFCESQFCSKQAQVESTKMSF
jgi:hypothetical protein